MTTRMKRTTKRTTMIDDVMKDDDEFVEYDSDDNYHAVHTVHILSLSHVPD